MLSPTPIDRPSLHPGTYLIAPRVPHGLAAVVEGLTREVLRHRPEDIYVFAAHHFEKLLKLREQYYAEEYNDREFNHEFNREFNLWSSKETENIRKVSHSVWSLRKEIESLEKHRREYTDAEESAEDVSSDRENRKTSKNLKGFSRETKRVSKRPKDNETTSDARAARIISQMSAAKSIQTKDIKQELRKNKLSGEKAKTTDTAEKGVKGEKRNRTKVLNVDKVPGEETERSTTITTSSSRTLARRPLKKVRRIETESETETEHEINKTGNEHCRPNVKNDRKAKAQTSEHSSERRISSRAISMDRIRAYVLRKFASTASLEVLRSPTYVEQVQEVIDRAAPIIKEKLEEIRRPRGKRSRSVDLAWNGESLREYARDEKRRCDHKEKEGRREKDENAGLERRPNIVKKEKSCLARKENISNTEREEKKTRIRNVGSGKRSRRRDHSDLEAVDRVDDNSRHNEPDVSCDTLEARLTATENILKDISRTTSELSGARKVESPENAPSELEMSDANVVSLPIVRPPSSKNSRSATKNDSDNLTLPPISPEAPKSTKKKDELSLPILPANGNHSKKSQEQDDLKNVEEASTMRDITSDIEDTAIFPEDSYEGKKDLSDDCHDLISDARITDKGTREGEDKVLQKDVLENLAEKQGSFEELEKLIESEGQKFEENFKDSLNVTPEIVDLPSRPDSLEEEKFQDGNVNTLQNKTFDGLKDKLIEIEMAERNIEKTLAGQSTAIYENGREKSNKDNEGKKDVNEKKEPMHELEQVKGEEIEKSSNETNKIENLKNKAAIKQAEISTKCAEEVDGVEDVAIKPHRVDMQSVNSELQSRDGQMITEMITRKTSNGKATASKNKSESETSKSTGIATSENTTDEVSTVNIPNESDTGKKKDQKKSEAEKLPATTALSLEIPFAYVLSEGSPCEIPESVTTVIIPDRQCSSPVIAEDDNQQKEQSLILSNEDKTQKKNQEEYGVEAFGEYIQDPESAVSSMDIDFMQGIKLTQNVVISHQDLDRIKEEGEEEEKEDNDKDIKKVMKHSEEKRGDNQAVTQNEKMPKLENITEHEENEHIDTKIISEHKDTEEMSSAISENQSLPDIMESVADTGLTDVERIDTMVESKSTLENSSEESGSSQNTTMTSDTKEDLASTRSTETPSLPIPVVPELNLDSLQDNTVSSFKITASETKEDNGSPRESDATSLIEPLTSDERLMNRVALTDHDEEVAVEKFTGRDLRSELPEADQLYRAEHAEYVWLEKDPLSADTNLEDKAKSQDSIGLTTLPENVVHAGPFSRGEENDEELNSEEEIARELIGSLDEEIQLRANEFNLKEKSEDNRKLEKNGLSVNKKSNRPLSEFVQSVSADEPKKIEHKVSSETMKTDEEVTKSEELSVVSSHVTDNNNDIATNKKHEESELEVKEKNHEIEIAPLAQFEQDELLEKNDKIDKITIEDVSDINNFIDDREQSEDKETSIEEVININKSISKEEELSKNQKENEQGKLRSPEKSIQKELQIQEEYEQEDLKFHEEDNEKKLKLQKEIADKEEIPAKVTESGKDSINESIKKNEKQEAKQISCNDFVTKKKEDIESKKEENAKPFSAEVEPVHGPIVSAITEESVENHPQDGYRAMKTKSSTVETMIEADDSNIIDENTKAAVNSEIIESLAQKKDDFYSAAVKIQACVRGFLVRRHKRKDLKSELVLPMQTTTDPLRSLQESKSGRRLRREVALQNTTLSLENAFATGRLQHTGEFHDSVPLPLFDIANGETNSIQSNGSLINEVEENTEEAKQPDIAQFSTDQNDCVNAHEIEQGESFQKDKNFADYPFPIMMQLLTDASRNCRFAVSQNPHSDFNANVGGMKLMEPTVDIVMLGYPRNDDNQYLNFITSVEDLGSNMNSLSQEDATRYSKNIGDNYPSMTPGEGSIREPLALPGTPQGVVIEEVTSLEAELPSESTNLSAVPKTSLDTNSSASLEEYTAKDEKNELGASKVLDEGIKRQTLTLKSQEEEDQMKEHNLNGEDDNTKSDKIFHDNHENVDEEKKEKIFP